MQVYRIAIAGFGGVGRATAMLLLSRREHYRQVYNFDVRLVAVCGSRGGAFDGDGLEVDRFNVLEEGKTGPDFIVSSGADVLIEAGPTDFLTGAPGLGYIRSALSLACDIIVVSKGALVHDGRAIRERARASGAMLKISGATAAALPTIDLLEHSLLGCSVLKVEGILNGTSNYLLDSMVARGIGFEAALREAQAAGITEPDPRNDIEGWDTACKLLILANFGLSMDLAMDDLVVHGIQEITAYQIAGWRAEGLTPRLVASLIRENDTIQAGVGVRAYPSSDLFSHVLGKNKAIRIVTHEMGDIVAIGGASGLHATAAAALKDLEHILRARSGQTSGSFGVSWKRRS